MKNKHLYIILGCIIISYLILMSGYLFDITKLSDNNRIIVATIWFFILTIISLWMIKPKQSYENYRRGVI